MKNVLIICYESIKNQLCDKFVQGAINAGNNVDIALLEEDIRFCTKCTYCVIHKGKCTIKDAAMSIIEKMFKADVIVFCCDVCNTSVITKFDALIGRAVALWNGDRNKTVCSLLLESCHNNADCGEAIDIFRSFNACVSFSEEMLMVSCNNDNASQCFAKAYELGENI